MGAHDFSQLSITRDKRIVGSLNETHLYNELVSDPGIKSEPVIPAPPPPQRLIELQHRLIPRHCSTRPARQHR